MKVVLFVLDSVRADAPSFTGGPAATPTLDRLASEGVVFRHAHCSGSWTIPSLVSMLTGCSPPRTGVCNWRHRPHPDVPFLPDHLADHDLPTKLYAANPRWIFAGWPVPPETGDSQDLDGLAADLAAPGAGLYVVHHWWTHIPYTARRASWEAHRTVAGRMVEALHRDPTLVAARLRGLYHRAITHWSEVILPPLLEALASSGEDHLVVVTADHGESWGELVPGGAPVEHIFDLHGRWLEDATTAVPLVMWGRTAHGAIRPAQIDTGFARGIDLAPTLAEAFGVPPLRATDGQGLLGCLHDSERAPADAALTVGSQNTWIPETYPRSGTEMWRTWSLRDAQGRHTWDARSDEARPDFAAAHGAARGPHGVDVAHSPSPQDRRLAHQLRTLGYG